MSWASGTVKGFWSNRICNFLGNISYPLYITHFPIIYLYYSWIERNHITIDEAIPMAATVLVASILIAYLTMRYIDIPARKWLTEKFMKR
ncbi:acyltransferase family protein [Flavobacterium sp. 3HN19-14]|uniref:acyltransferase family protein n=1 Tax=Flavobacterium sp. 3HN19-14 TaxID=3448133 RepID=UPI003EDF58D3